ncbi:MAG TPA: dTMP kinase [Leptolyngbyaceae cyanobacterium M33_DOE_097]|uniref:Thymidylate kinase n=1 Tax=Oscillatoriales cyanobacterium SpSt-418 TaxID=2282169 RepID=A0A7C3KE44_9CYAN|nr:dTMP kinase [Leptolyngbyaceae cyanobacterium M33_DOE_097]
MQGKLIVFEGGEGSGKTTQIRQIRAWLESSGWFEKLKSQGHLHQLVITREPGGTELSQSIRQLLLGYTGEEPMQARTELLLYAADRAQHVEYYLRPLLEQGALILCDRYTDSTVAYQGYGRGLEQALIAQLNQIATNGLVSDLTLWLDVPVEVGLHRTQQRGTVDRIEQADISFHQRVREGFMQLAQEHPERIVWVDASPSEAEVTLAVQQAIALKFQEWYGEIR